MNEEQTIEANKTIAEFMGATACKLQVKPIGVVDAYECEEWKLPIDEIEYHSSWDWLMPVVEQIEKLHDGIFSFFIVQSECDIAFSKSYKENGDDWDAPNFAQKKGDKLISTWSAVIEFIKWYKNQSVL